MKILVTGNMGYVGSALTRHLRATFEDAELIGYDSGYFAHCITTPEGLPEVRLQRQHFGDVRELSEDLLKGVDAVVHLAAVSNDPMGNRFEAPTEEINYRASVDGGRARPQRRGEELRVRLELQHLRLRRGRAAQGNGSAQSADRLRAVEDRDRAGPGANGFRRHGRHLPAFRNRLRHVRPAAPRSGAERLRGLRAGPRGDHGVERRLTLAASHRRERHGPGDRMGNDPLRRERRPLSRRQRRIERLELPGQGHRRSGDRRRSRHDHIDQPKRSPRRALLPRRLLPLQVACAVSPTEDDTPGHGAAPCGIGLERIGFADPNFRSSRWIRLRVLEEHIQSGRLSPGLWWMVRGAAPERVPLTANA